MVRGSVVNWALAAALIAPAWAVAQQTEQPPQQETQAAEEKAEEKEAKIEEEITVTGTRVEGRTVTDTPAPVSYIDAEAIQSIGSTETGKILQLLEPSANFSTTFISDGTDAVRPATLRALGPDQSRGLLENLVASRVVPEDEAGDADGDEEQRGQGEDGVVGERGGGAGRPIRHPVVDGRPEDGLDARARRRRRSGGAGGGRQVRPADRTRRPSRFRHAVVLLLARLPPDCGVPLCPV